MNAKSVTSKSNHSHPPPETTAVERSFEVLRAYVDRGGPEPSEYSELTSAFHPIISAVRTGLISADILQEYAQSLGEAFFSTETMQGHCVRKPYGYSGDFEIIDRIYQERISPLPHLARWDRYFHAQAAPLAVRNRKAYFQALLREHAHLSDAIELTVLNVASGPCRDLFEYFSDEPDRTTHVTCVDHDGHAVQYARALLRPWRERVGFQQRSLFQLRPRIQYGLVWSAGLFDYFDDALFQRALTHLLRFVAPGGELVIGNFSPVNPTRDYMKFGGWYLNHRTAEQLIELGSRCGLTSSQMTVDSEPLGVNLFLRVIP